jgi:hypothetical protein
VAANRRIHFEKNGVAKWVTAPENERTARLMKAEFITEPCPPPESEGPEREESGERFVVALAERMEYLLVVASNFGSDPELTKEETARLIRLCHDLELDAQQTDHILSVARLSCTARR